MSFVLRIVVGLFYIFAGAMTVLVFSPVNAFWVGFVSFIPLLYLSSFEKAGARAVLGYLFGLGFFCSGLYWLPDSATAFFGFPRETSFLISILLLAYLAIYPAIFAWLIKYAGTVGSFQVFVSWPLLWCALELLRSYLVGGVPWLGIGLGQLDGPLEVYFALIGELGVGYLVVLINGLLYLLFRRNGEWAYKGALVLVLIFTVSMSLKFATWTEPEGKAQRVALVHAGVAQQDKWELHMRDQIIDEYRALSLPHVGEVDWLLWPETAVPVFSNELTAYFPELAKSAQQGDLIWLTGSLEQAIKGGDYNSLMVLSSKALGLYRKKVLVPFGEQLRFSYLVELLDLPFAQQRDKSVGQLSSLMVVNDVPVGASICWEIRFSGLVAQPVIEGAGVLVNVANEAWSDHSPTLHRSLQVSRARAMEVGRPLLRASNLGWSGLIDYQGRVLHSLAPDAAGSLVVKFQSRAGMTPYIWLMANKGWWIILSVMFFAVVAERVIWLRRSR